MIRTILTLALFLFALLAPIVSGAVPLGQGLVVLGCVAVMLALFCAAHLCPQWWLATGARWDRIVTCYRAVGLLGTIIVVLARRRD